MKLQHIGWQHGRAIRTRAARAAILVPHYARAGAARATSVAAYARGFCRGLFSGSPVSCPEHW